MTLQEQHTAEGDLIDDGGNWTTGQEMLISPLRQATEPRMAGA